jgi:hypothetical protein
MEAFCSSEISVHFQRTTRRYIPGGSTLFNDRCENFKSYVSYVCFLVGYLTALPASKLYGQVGGIKMGKEAEVFRKNPTQCHSIHHKYLVTWPRIKPEPPWAIPATKACLTAYSAVDISFHLNLNLRFLGNKCNERVTNVHTASILK